MMKQNLFLTATLFCLFGIGVSGVQSQSHLILKLKDGTEQSAALSTVSKISFTENDLKMNYVGGGLNTYAISSIGKIVFGANTSAVRTTLSDKTEISIYPNPATDYIALKNAPEGVLSVTIYRLDGAQLLNLQLSTASQQIDISGLSKGLYLLKVNNQAFKFSKL